MRNVHRLMAGVVLALGWSLSGDVASQASELDPSLPRSTAIGSPPSAAPVLRVDGAASGRTAHQLPERPTETNRLSVGVAAQVPVFDRDGNIAVALASPEVVFFASDGRERSRARIGVSPALRPPVPTSDGGLAVLTAAPSLVFFSKDRAIVSTIGLAKAFASQTPEGVSITPGEDGGVVLTAERQIVSFAADGRIKMSAELPSGQRAFGSPLRTETGLLVAAASGELFAVEAPNQPRRIGHFGATLMGQPALLDDRRVVAQVALGRVASVDRLTHAAVTHFSELYPMTLEPQLTVAADRSLRVVASDGQVVAVDSGGAELFRAPVDRPVSATVVARPGIGAVPAVNRGSLLLDADGDLLVARLGGRLMRVAKDGATLLVSERACASPAHLIPLGELRFALYCREGTLVFYGEADPP